MSKAEVKTFKQTSDCDRTYVQGGDATGDIIHVFAALKQDPKAALVVFQWDNSSAAAIQQKMVALGIEGKRILVQVEQPGARNTIRNRVTSWCKDAGFQIIQLHESTANAIQALQDTPLRKSIHVTLRGAKDITPDDQRFLDFWVSKFQAVEIDHDVVILWGRSSGKDKTTADKFGAHPYGDSSTTGLIQVAEKCLEKQWKVVLAGDIAETKRGRFAKECVYIGRFWRDPFWQPQTLNQKEQVRCFYILKRVLGEKSHRMVHVGMRSGTMDYYAFAGQRIVYLVAQGFDDRRIEALVNAFPKRWMRGQPDKTPRQGYQRTWDPEWLNVVGRTDLRQLMADDAQQQQREMFKAIDYPIDPQTQINGNLLYRAIKAKLKQDPAYGQGSDVLNAFLAEKSKRGFSGGYLTELVNLIAAGLVK